MRKYLLIFLALLFFAASVLKMDEILAPVENSSISPPYTLIQDEKTYVGHVVCLPEKDTSSSQLLECAVGLALENGDYVALDFGSTPGNYPQGEKLQIKGTFTPIEKISSMQWQKYIITGIVSVQDVTKLQ